MSEAKAKITQQRCYLCYHLTTMTIKSLEQIIHEYTYNDVTCDKAESEYKTTDYSLEAYSSEDDEIIEYEQNEQLLGMENDNVRQLILLTRVQLRRLGSFISIGLLQKDKCNVSIQSSSTTRSKAIKYDTNV